MYQKFGIKKEILDLSEEVEKEIQPIFKNIEKIEQATALWQPWQRFLQSFC